LSFSSLLF